MTHDECFKAALNLIQVTPENYEKLNADMIKHIYRVIAESEGITRPPSAYEGKSADEIEKMTSI